MKIKNHIAYLFLSNNNMAHAILRQLCPNPQTEVEEKMAQTTWNLVSTHSRMIYYITDTVMKNLDLLKVRVNKDGGLDWSVFQGRIEDGKYTYILPDNRVVRVMAYSGTRLGVCLITGGAISWRFTTAFLDRASGMKSKNWVKGSEIWAAEDILYRLLCFLYLSENEYVEVGAGEKHGTRKSGKIINDLPFPVTMVTSKWNVTYVRTEGFAVSGHFRLWLRKATSQYELIFIKPHTRSGYIRRSHAGG